MGIRLPRSLTNDQQGEPPVVSIRSQRVQKFVEKRPFCHVGYIYVGLYINKNFPAELMVKFCFIKNCKFIKSQINTNFGCFREAALWECSVSMSES